MPGAAFGIFDHVDRSDEPIGALYEHRLKLVEAVPIELTPLQRPHPPLWQGVTSPEGAPPRPRAASTSSGPRRTAA
jgi:hypothetical protein